jgi:hypothetical protein
MNLLAHCAEHETLAETKSMYVRRRSRAKTAAEATK